MARVRIGSLIVELGEVIRVGAVTVAAVVRRSVRGHVSHAVSIHGVKVPVAVLIRGDEVTMAFEIDGPQIALNTFERRFPGQRANFERVAMADALCPQ